MLIGLEHRFLFLAVAKTASTAIESGLGPHAEITQKSTQKGKHMSLREALTEFEAVFAAPGQEPETFLKFAVMRDPIDRVYSWYRYRRGNKVRVPIDKDMDFATYWARRDWTVQTRSGKPTLQRTQFLDQSGEIGLDLILPYHDLAAQFARLVDLLGLDVPLNRSNRSTIRGSTDEIPPGILAEMQAHFRADCDLYETLASFNEPGWARAEARKAARASHA